jgi:hypothetical protein
MTDHTVVRPIGPEEEIQNNELFSFLDKVLRHRPGRIEWRRATVSGCSKFFSKIEHRTLDATIRRKRSTHLKRPHWRATAGAVHA